MEKKYIIKSLLASTLLLVGCQSTQSNDQADEVIESKVEEAVESTQKILRSVPSGYAIPLTLDEAGVMISAQGHLLADSSREESFKQPKVEQKVVAEEEKEVEKELELAEEEIGVAKTEESVSLASLSQPNSESNSAQQTEKKDPVVETSKPDPKPESEPAPAAEPEPIIEYVGKETVTNRSKANALVETLNQVIPYNIRPFVPGDGGHYVGYGDVILHEQWLGNPGDLYDRAEGLDALERITQYLDSNGYSYYGQVYETDYDTFIHAAGKRYRKSITALSKDFEIHIIVE